LPDDDKHTIKPSATTQSNVNGRTHAPREQQFRASAFYIQLHCVEYVWIKRIPKLRYVQLHRFTRAVGHTNRDIPSVQRTIALPCFGADIGICTKNRFATKAVTMRETSYFDSVSVDSSYIATC
jgi:hypothetical protein